MELKEFSQRLSSGKDTRPVVIPVLDLENRLSGRDEHNILEALLRRGQTLGFLSASDVGRIATTFGQLLFLRAAGPDSGLLNDSGEIVKADLEKSLVNASMPDVRLAVFALDQKHWDVKDVLVMLAGNLVSDATKAIHQDLQKLIHILLQA